MLSSRSDLAHVTLGIPRTNDDDLGERSHNKVRPGAFLFFTSCPRDLDRCLNLDNLMKMRTAKDSRNSEGPAVVAVMEPFASERHRNTSVAVLLDLCLVYYFARCVILVPRRATEGTSVVVDVFSRSHSFCIAENELTVVLVDTWVAEGRGFLSGADLFPANLKLDFKGCRLTVHFDTPYFPLVFTIREQFQGPGFEVLLMFCRKFNCSLSPNVHRAPDIIFPVAYTDDYILEDVGLSYPHFLESYTWFVPSGRKFPRWKVIFRVFSPLLSLLVFLTGVLGTLTLWLLIKPSARVGKVGYSLLTHLGVGATDYFQGPLSVAFFTLWLFYCLLINTAYQSGLFTLLVDPGEHAPLEAFAELEKSGLHMTSIINFRSDTKYSSEVLDKYELLQCSEGQYFCFQEVARSKSRAMLFYKDVGVEYARFFKDPLGKPQVLHLKDSFVTINAAFHAPLFLLLMRPLDRVLSIAVDSGIVDKCMRQAFRDFVLFFPHKTQQGTEKVFAFTFEHLQGPFYLLMTGLSLSAVAYLLEISFYYCFQRKLFLV